MELVNILRELWSRKRLLALVLAVALLGGLLVALRPGLPPQSRQYQVWVASADILVDSRDSQVVAVGRRGPSLPTLAARANLLGNLMAVGPLKDRIAHSAGIRPGKLVVKPPLNVTAGVAPMPANTAAGGTVPDRDARILSISIDPSLPILSVSSQAPDGSTAQRLARAAVVELTRYVGSVAASQQTPAARQLVLRKLGTTLAQPATRGPGKLLALATIIIVALLGCAAIVAVTWFVRSWRQGEEQLEEVRGGRTALTPQNGVGDGAESKGSAVGPGRRGIPKVSELPLEKEGRAAG